MARGGFPGGNMNSMMKKSAKNAKRDGESSTRD